ncbi:MAG: HEPN domain-containing protein [Deltaproteobacteria bacterium]|nr:HEPN domain-containing protein [Deltaproteobacteria bacterium]
MKSPDEVKLELTKRWIAKADEDYAVSEILLSEEISFPSPICFHCQQACEKYLKAYLVWYQIEFPKTHDLDELLDLIAKQDANFSKFLQDISILSVYGVDVRYPGDIPISTDDDAKQALELTKQIRESVKNELDKLMFITTTE